MSQPLPGTPAQTWTTAPTVPQDGVDLDTAASLYPSTSQLRDNTAYLAALAQGPTFAPPTTTPAALATTGKGSGPSRMQLIATVGALATTRGAVGDVCQLAGRGVYQLRIATGLSADAAYVVDRTSPAWAPSTAYVSGDTVANAGKWYLCLKPGTSDSIGSGPNTTGSNITDGTTAWAYTSSSGPCQWIWALEDVSVNAGPANAADYIIRTNADGVLDPTLLPASPVPIDIAPSATWAVVVQPKYWKDYWGIVHLEGLAEFLTGASNTIFNLPVGFRPPANRFFASADATDPTALVTVEVGSSGNVIFQNVLVNHDQYALDGISFRGA